jgi:UDP-glucose:(heptosyl)LPS alpha-1,3-glucosyltransferase
MRLAFVLYKCHPDGVKQRDFRHLVEELQRRGHHCRVYCGVWQGEALAGVELRRMPATALRYHRRNQRFFDSVRTDLANNPVDGVIGFDAMPGLDIYFAAESCYLDKTHRERGRLYRGSARFRHLAEWERTVFASAGDTQILLLSESQRDTFARIYHTPPQRMHLLPPGVAPDRRAPPDAPERRRAMRASLGLAPQELTLLFIGPDFIARGLDRAITTLAHLRAEQPSVQTRLLVVGLDKPRRFQRLARKLDVAGHVEFLGRRDDVLDLMSAADLLLYPARDEAAGIALLEALAAGLPAVVTDVCGYAHHVSAARAGVLLPAPFSQQQLDRAAMRYIDGVFRADCRNSALLYARLTDLYSMHSRGAELVEQLIGRKIETRRG